MPPFIGAPYVVGDGDSGSGDGKPVAHQPCAAGAHDLIPWVTFHHAPTGPYPEHTTFLVFLCQRCGAYSCQPPQNYVLVTPEFRQLLERLATEAGWFLVEHGI